MREEEKKIGLWICFFSLSLSNEIVIIYALSWAFHFVYGLFCFLIVVGTVLSLSTAACSDSQPFLMKKKAGKLFTVSNIIFQVSSC